MSENKYDLKVGICKGGRAELKRLSGHSAKSEMWNIAVIGRHQNFKTFLETDSNFELIHIYLLLFYTYCVIVFY